jgi:hypothetical protein
MPDTLEVRRARYERIVAMRSNGTTLKAIGASLDPPLTKERVRQIAGREPKRTGRPRSGQRLITLRHRLQFWDAQRAERARVGRDTFYADARITALSEQIAALETS